MVKEWYLSIVPLTLYVSTFIFLDSTINLSLNLVWVVVYLKIAENKKISEYEQCIVCTFFKNVNKTI